MVFLTVECASRIQYPELWISFSVIPFRLWAAILWWCFISKGPVTFPTFGDNIGCLHSFKNEFSNLPPTWITSSPSKIGSKREILLLLSSALFKSLEFFKDFNHQKSSLKLCCCIIFTNFVFASCSKLVFSRVTPFTFLMMSGWYTLHALWQDTTNSFFNWGSFSLSGGIMLSYQLASGSQRNCGPSYHLLTLSSLQTSIPLDA